MTIPASLAKLLQADETAYEMLRRSGLGTLKGSFPVTGLDDLDDLMVRIEQSLTPEQQQPCHVLEVEGESGTGKSFLLMSLAARVAETGASVWYFDFEQRLSLERFARFFQREECMSRVSIIRPTTSKEFLASLHQLNEEDVPVRLVVLDSLLGFYQMNVLTDPLGAGYFFSMPHLLFDLATRLGFVVAASKPSVSFEIASKTWAQSVSRRVIFTGRGRAIVKVPAFARAQIAGQPLQDGTIGEIGFDITRAVHQRLVHTIYRLCYLLSNPINSLAQPKTGLHTCNDSGRRMEDAKTLFAGDGMADEGQRNNTPSARRSTRVRKLAPGSGMEFLSQREEKEMRLAIEKSMNEIQAPVGLTAIEALTLRPTMEEFANPIAFIVKNKEKVAQNGGIAKIVPPEGWACRFELEKQGLEIPTKEQLVNRLGEGIPYGTGADYDFDSYKEMAEKFRDRWTAVLRERGEDPDDWRAWERTYWRIVEGGESEQVVVEYGNDVSTEELGGGFPKLHRTSEDDNEEEEMWVDQPDFQNNEYYARSEWNLSNIAWARKSILGNLKDLINGINVPWLYFGMTFATFSWHVEDNWLYSINYHHYGHPKLWYGLGPEYQHRFKQVLKEMMPIRFNEQPDLLSDITTMVNPSWLLSRGIQVHTILQQPGEFVITLPGAYHGGFSLGFNVGEAVNFAPIDWITPGRLCRDMYRSEARAPVIAHDKIVWGICQHSHELSKSELRLLIEELEVLLKTELEMRNHAMREGVSFSVLMPQEDFSSDESDIRRTCIKCNQPCSLHAIICDCAPEKAACGLHQQYLCTCPAVKKAMVMWSSIDGLRQKIRQLQDELDLRVE